MLPSHESFCIAGIRGTSRSCTCLADLPAAIKRYSVALANKPMLRAHWRFRNGCLMP